MHDQSRQAPSAHLVPVLTGRFDDLLSRGLRAVIESDPSVRLVAWDVERARLGSSLQTHAAKVAIVDCAALASPAEVRDLRRRHPTTSLILLTDNPSGAECAQMLAFGASACLGKSTEARDVLNAIHLASRGLQVAPRPPGNGVPLARTSADLLTGREAEVLALLREAKPNAQIAAMLHVSVETVRTHARNIYRKLGVSSRRELFAPPPGSMPAPSDTVAVGPPGRTILEDRHRSPRGSRRPGHS